MDINNAGARSVLEIMATSRDRVLVRAQYDKFASYYPEHEAAVRYYWSRFFDEHWDKRHENPPQETHRKK